MPSTFHQYLLLNFLYVLQLVTKTSPNGYGNTTSTVTPPSTIISNAFPGEPALAVEDDVSLLWLNNHALTP